MDGQQTPVAKGITREAALAGFSKLPWDDYVRARAFLTAQEVNDLRRTEERTLDIVLGDAEFAKRLVGVLLKVVGVINDLGAQQYALTRLDDILSGKSDQDGSVDLLDIKEFAKRAKYFQNDEKAIDERVWVRVLRNDGADAYCKTCAASCFARLLTVSTNTPDEFVAWACHVLSTISAGASVALVEGLVKALTIALRRIDARALFTQHGGIGYLTRVLKAAAAGGNHQLQYDLSLALWTLSFAPEAKQLFLSAGAVPLLVEQLTAAPREKVVRVSLACVRNLVTDEDYENFEVTAGIINLLVAYSLPQTLSNFKDRNNWKDEDIKNDVEAVHTVLMANYRELSTYERWASELSVGQLKWGSKLVHNDKFWRENVKELERNDFAALKKLITLLDSPDNECVAVACYDLGEFVRYFPNGKSLARNLGAKDKVMRLVEHDNLEVQREALKCVSKIMVNQWEFLR